MDWSNYISQNVGQETISDLNNYVYEAQNIDESPIDIFYSETRSIISRVPRNATKEEWKGALALVALVSTTENYFRNILQKLIQTCPITKKNAGSNSINLGSAMWHKTNQVERGAFEHFSFSESKKIKEATRKYVGVELNKTDIEPIIEEFNKICEIRHAIVHSSRYLAGKNAINLDIDKAGKDLKIGIAYAQIQEAGSICTTLVVAYNLMMFKVMGKRWALNWRDNTWDREIEDNSFKRLWAIFHSKIDRNNGTIPLQGTWIKCRNSIKKEFNLTT